MGLRKYKPHLSHRLIDWLARDLLLCPWTCLPWSEFRVPSVFCSLCNYHLVSRAYVINYHLFHHPKGCVVVLALHRGLAPQLLLHDSANNKVLSVMFSPFWPREPFGIQINLRSACTDVCCTTVHYRDIQISRMTLLDRQLSKHNLWVHGRAEKKRRTSTFDIHQTCKKV